MLLWPPTNSMSRRSPKAGMHLRAQQARRTAARLGQNFLMHPSIAQRIVRIARLSSDKVVLEIGPGRGILTRELLKVAKHVIAIELDEHLYQNLRTQFADDIDRGTLDLIRGDVRNVGVHLLPKDYALVANIPYYITGETIRTFLESESQPNSMTLLVQKEVAERIARSKKESLLSLSVKAYGTAKLEFVVPRGAFIPAPRVDSAVLTIRDISRKNFMSRQHESRFFEIIRAGFAHKRKFVRSNIAPLIKDAPEIPQKARAEDVPLPVWLTVAKNQL
jgi:16S rRNA (adenine1518-N6/adenine1519-N6)-dimethyltransferase